MDYQQSFKTSFKTLNIIITIFGSVTVIGGAYWFYRNNIWKPKVTIKSLDHQSKRAVIDVNGKEKIINGSTDTIGIGGDWGVRYSTEVDGVEVVRNNLVHEYVTT